MFLERENICKLAVTKLASLDWNCKIESVKRTVQSSFEYCFPNNQVSDRNRKDRKEKGEKERSYWLLFSREKVSGERQNCKLVRERVRLCYVSEYATDSIMPLMHD